MFDDSMIPLKKFSGSSLLPFPSYLISLTSPVSRADYEAEAWEQTSRRNSGSEYGSIRPEERDFKRPTDGGGGSSRGSFRPMPSQQFGGGSPRGSQYGGSQAGGDY